MCPDAVTCHTIPKFGGGGSTIINVSDSDKMAVRVQENSIRQIEEHPRFEVRCPKDNVVGSPSSCRPRESKVSLTQVGSIVPNIVIVRGQKTRKPAKPVLNLLERVAYRTAETTSCVPGQQNNWWSEFALHMWPSYIIKLAPRQRTCDRNIARMMSRREHVVVVKRELQTS